MASNTTKPDFELAKCKINHLNCEFLDLKYQLHTCSKTFSQYEKHVIGLRHETTRILQQLLTALSNNTCIIVLNSEDKTTTQKVLKENIANIKIVHRLVHPELLDHPYFAKLFNFKEKETNTFSERQIMHVVGYIHKPNFEKIESEIRNLSRQLDHATYLYAADRFTLKQYNKCSKKLKELANIILQQLKTVINNSLYTIAFNNEDPAIIEQELKHRFEQFNKVRRAAHPELVDYECLHKTNTNNSEEHCIIKFRQQIDLKKASRMTTNQKMNPFTLKSLTISFICAYIKYSGKQLCIGTAPDRLALPHDAIRVSNYLITHGFTLEQLFLMKFHRCFLNSCGHVKCPKDWC